MLSQEWFWEAAFWFGVWVLAGFAGTCRAIRDREYSDCLRLVNLGLFSGLVGFGTIAVWVGGVGGHVGNEWRYLGLATLIGAAGKEQERLVRYVVSTTFDKFGIPRLPSEEVQEDSSVLGDDSTLGVDDGTDRGDSVEHDSDQPESK